MSNEGDPFDIALGYEARQSGQGILRLRAGIEILGCEAVLTCRPRSAVRVRRLVIPPPFSQRFGIVDLRVGFSSVFADPAGEAGIPDVAAHGDEPAYWRASRWEGCYRFAQPGRMLDVLASPGPTRAVIPRVLGRELPAMDCCLASQDVSITLWHHGDGASDFEALLVVDLLEPPMRISAWHAHDMVFVGEVVAAYLETPEGQWATLDDVLRCVHELCPAWATMREDVAHLVDLHRSP